MEFRSPTAQSAAKMLAISCVMGGAVCLLLWIYVGQGGSRVYAASLFLLTVLSLAAFFYIGPFWTRLVLEPRALWIGYRSRGREIPYDVVRFINAWQGGGRRGARRLFIETERRKYMIELSGSDLRRILPELRTRCRHACGIDYDGDSFAPADPADALAGSLRVVRFWRGQAAVWLGLAAAIVCAAGIAVTNKGGRSLTAGPLAGLAVLVAQTVAFGSYAIVRFRRASRIVAILRPRPG